MRYTLFILVTLALLVGCKKERTPKIALSLTANGKQYEFNNVILTKIPAPRPFAVDSVYLLSAEDGQTTNSLFVYIKTNQLTEVEYSVPSASTIGFTSAGFSGNNKLYGAIFNDDYLKITFTEISFRGVTGFFSAVMHDMQAQGPTAEKMVITNGYFANVAISQ